MMLSMTLISGYADSGFAESGNEITYSTTFISLDNAVIEIPTIHYDYLRESSEISTNTLTNTFTEERTSCIMSLIPVTEAAMEHNDDIVSLIKSGNTQLLSGWPSEKHQNIVDGYLSVTSYLDYTVGGTGHSITYSLDRFKVDVYIEAMSPFTRPPTMTAKAFQNGSDINGGTLPLQNAFYSEVNSGEIYDIPPAGITWTPVLDNFSIAEIGVTTYVSVYYKDAPKDTIEVRHRVA